MGSTKKDAKLGFRFRPYTTGDFEACLNIFDGNCPEFFAPNERPDYETFLFGLQEGYQVCEVDGLIKGAFGLLETRGSLRLHWIMILPDAQGIGMGSEMMKEAIRIAEQRRSHSIQIAASQKSAPFFA